MKALDNAMLGMTEGADVRGYGMYVRGYGVDVRGYGVDVRCYDRRCAFFLPPHAACERTNATSRMPPLFINVHKQFGGEEPSSSFVGGEPNSSVVEGLIKGLMAAWSPRVEFFRGKRAY
eukprot:4473615-Pyramimonas_sp.AAC.2